MSDKTLFVKINGKFKDFLYNLEYNLEHSEDLNKEPKLSSIIMTGTVKLHGNHGDIVIEKGDCIRIQSRNKAQLTIQDDVQGFAAFMEPLASPFLALKIRYFDRFSKLNPNTKIDDECPFIMAGEWIGPGIQKKVAINRLPKKCFVICCVNVNGAWLPDVPYQDISDEVNGIFNISRGGYYTQVFPLYGDQTPALDVMQSLANQVEAECPFAKSFGIIGRGEGIVWKAQPPFENERLWFKTKGPISNGTNIPRKVYTSREEFIAAVVSNERLDQAWQYLAEMKLPQTEASCHVFLMDEEDIK